MMKQSWDEQEEVPRLPQKVEVLLRQICEDKKQPWPDADAIRQLAAQSEESAMETLKKISTSTSIRTTLGRYIKWMIRQCSSASPSPSKTVRSAHVQSPDATSLTPQRLHFSPPGEAVGDGSPVVGQLPYCSGSPSKAAVTCSCQRLSAHAQVDEGSRGEAFNHLSPVIGQSPYSSGSPLKAADTSSYQRLSAPVQLDERFQGDAFSHRSPVGQPPYSSASPSKAAGTTSYQRLSPPVQLDDTFQGEAFNHRSPVIEQSPYSSGSPLKAAGTSYQRLSAPVQHDERFQGDAFSHPSSVGQPPYSSASPSKAAGEAFTVLEQPGNINNGQSPYYSSGSPLKVARTCSCQSPSALVAPIQLDKKFQGDTFTDRSLVRQLPCSCGSSLKATGSYERLSTPIQADERFHGEAFSARSAVGQLPCSSVSPLKSAVTSSYQRLSTPVQLDERFQVEAFNDRAPVIGQSPYSSGSPLKAASTSYQRLTAPLQLDERFQGGVFADQTPVQGQSPYASCSPSKAFCISPYQRMSADVVPVQLHERFQGEGITRSSVIDKPGDHGEAHLVALGELEFRKQFLILSYAGGMKLRDLIAAEDIRDWKYLPMVTFESKIWEYLGRKCISLEDRRLNFDWDSGRTHVYYCYVNVDGSYIFKGPYLYKIRRTLLQKKLGDDNVLMVKFAKEEVQRGQSIACHHNYSMYMKVAREGILVGLRRYRFFVFKDGGNEEKKKNPTSSPVKCYFVRVASDAAIDKGVSYILSNRTMYEARCLFMHAHTLASIDNYMIRFSLILSKTTSLNVDWSVVKVEIIGEEYCLDESGNRIHRDEKPLIHTDGTGFISEDLALICPKIEAKGQSISDEHMKGLPDPDELEDNDMGKKRPVLRTEEPPLLTQCRLFHNGSASKGTFLVNKKLHPNTIQIRPSMLKVKTDPTISNNQTINSLEIVGTSTPPRNTHLSRILIALLMHGGVPEEFFMQILNQALEDAHGVFCKIRAALKVAEKYGEIDDNFLGKLMISFGIPLEESYLRYRLSVLMKEENNSLRKGKLYIPDSYNLMGTADPTGTLKKDEVCVILKDGQLSGKVLVYRYPGLHFGDIHVLKATYVKELESFVGNAKYGIFFSCKGPRSIADEMGGGDFDGDLYWVSRNPQLLEWYKPSEPWIEASISTQKVPSRSPSDYSPEDLEDVLFRSFLTTRFEPSFAMSEAADNWLAWMDRFLTLGESDIDEKNNVKDKILQLINLYYTALDAPKKGVKVVVPKELKVPCFPHYMGKNNSYPSTSVLGLICNRVDEHQTEDHSLKEVEKLPAFDVNEVPDACLDKWEELHRQYRSEMASAMDDADKQSKNQSADVVIRKYKKILYEANDFEESRRPIDEIYNEAQAIYHVCYDHARRIGGVKACSFAWKVAGKALCQLHAKNTNERCCTIVSSVLKEIL
ncbi:probable RNA-dependent RNA polymerase 5 isoform X1 [Rosa rugosa]|uniref:probable RNA-dependent RNA polymerase 5 isoform X1 n=1 Tax=Rosa rugosa TaxID=74645 RepID=UPI002B40BA19|nr:probable RNA-dependent RNA polymerase 5 isoform X1 [Rosa rugosa]